MLENVPNSTSWTENCPEWKRARGVKSHVPVFHLKYSSFLFLAGSPLRSLFVHLYKMSWLQKLWGNLSRSKESWTCHSRSMESEFHFIVKYSFLLLFVFDKRQNQIQPDSRVQCLTDMNGSPTHFDTHVGHSESDVILYVGHSESEITYLNYKKNCKFFFFFLSFPGYISGVHHFWVRFLRMWPFFNPTIKVVKFRLRGWCVLGVFLLPAFTRLGHERQDLLSPCDEMHVCTD